MTGYNNDKAHVSQPGKLFEHWCDDAECKAWGTFGYKTNRDQFWFCREHKQQGEDVLFGKK